jgi:hypothetical protein
MEMSGKETFQGDMLACNTGSSDAATYFKDSGNNAMLTYVQDLLEMATKQGTTVEALYTRSESRGDDVGKKEEEQFAAVRDPRLKWPNNEVPFVFSDQFAPRDRSVVLSAMHDIEQNTCVRFRNKGPGDADYIHIFSGTGCYSYVGHLGVGKQMVSLGPGCMIKGIVIHELYHALGFQHEQSRTDRDNYITIYQQNIQSHQIYNFDAYSEKQIDLLGLPYDYGSIMHYGPTAFGVYWNSITIQPKTPGVQIGQRDGLSKLDIEKMNRHYGCKTSTVDITTEVTSKPIDITTSSPIVYTCVDSYDFCEQIGFYCRKARGSFLKFVQDICKKTCGTCSKHLL